MSAVLWEDVLKSKLMHLKESSKTVVTKVLGQFNFIPTYKIRIPMTRQWYHETAFIW